MRCARCKEENPPHAKFCEQCGTRLARPCSSCGAPLSPNGLAKLYRRTGTSGQAREHLTTATTMYREMDMPFWLEQAEAVDS
jgi:predicted amidophosphoribosyltransferase